MTTDLRKILSEAADALDAISAGHRIDNPIAVAQNAIATKLRSLADAPPTVAELLPLVDATHEVHWTDVDGDEWRVRCIHGHGVGPRTVIEVCERGEWTDGASEVAYPLASDFKLPATLVEVTP